MPRDILSEYGKDSGAGNKPSATNGGVLSPRDVRNYSPPKGPSNIMESQTPGLHGSNHGNTGPQGRH